MKPIIGIISRVSYPGGTKELCIEEEYRNAIIKSGGNPILILPPQEVDYTSLRYNDQEELTEEEKEMLINQIKLCNGILKPGGFKINKYDRFITEYLIENDVPTLGVCLGMQIMANFKRDLWNEKNDSYINHKSEEKLVHNVTLDKSSKLYEIIGKETFPVNSRHSFHILPNDYYDISAVSEDNYIEGIERKDKRFFVGVQWHPEKMDDETSKKLFDAFIKVCE